MSHRTNLHTRESHRIERGLDFRLQQIRLIPIYSFKCHRCVRSPTISDVSSGILKRPSSHSEPKYNINYKGLIFLKVKKTSVSRLIMFITAIGNKCKHTILFHDRENNVRSMTLPKMATTRSPSSGSGVCFSSP